LPTAVLGCRQRTIFIDSLTVMLSAKVTASDAVGTLRFFVDRLALPTVRLSAKMSLPTSFFYRLLATVRLSANNSLPTAGKGCQKKTFFVDCPYYGCRLNCRQSAKMPSPVVHTDESPPILVDVLACTKFMYVYMHACCFIFFLHINVTIISDC
jgi:hypothetical protein